MKKEKLKRGGQPGHKNNLGRFRHPEWGKKSKRTLTLSDSLWAKLSQKESVSEYLETLARRDLGI